MSAPDFLNAQWRPSRRLLPDHLRRYADGYTSINLEWQG